MNRRGLLKTLLGAVGLGALAPIVKAAPKPEEEPIFIGANWRGWTPQPTLHFTDFNAAPGPVYWSWTADGATVNQAGNVKYWRCQSK